MANKYIILNSTTMYPTEIQRNTTKVETTRRMANGTLKTYLRAIKKEFTISWSSASELTRNNARTIAALTASFSFQDTNGETYTVKCADGEDVLRADSISIGGVEYYDITLKLVEI